MERKKPDTCISGFQAIMLRFMPVLAWISSQGIPSKIRATPPLSWENYNANKKKTLN